MHDSIGHQCGRIGSGPGANARRGSLTHTALWLVLVGACVLAAGCQNVGVTMV